MTTVVHPGDSLSGRQRLVYILVLGALTALGPFTIDLYLPAFPVLQDEFVTSESTIQFTLAGTMVGFALGQLLIGPWSDKVGRRAPLLLATAVHVVASIGAVFSQEIVSFMIVRVLQGVGAAAGAVVAMAMVRDLFGGRPLVRMLSRLALINGLAPILAPLIGSGLLQVVSWRGIFVFLVAYGLIVLLAVWFFIVETLPPERRAGAGHNTVLQRYANVFRDRIFVGMAIIGGMTFSGLFAYLQGSTFLFQNHYGFSELEYGLLFAVNSVGVMIGVQSSSRLTKYVGPQWILAVAGPAMLISAGLIVLLPAMGVGMWGVIVPLFFFILACGFTFPLVQVLALVHHGHEAGTAASLLGATNFGLAGLLSPIVGLVGVWVGAQAPAAMSMGLVMMATSVIAIITLWLVVRPRTVPELSH